MEKKTPENSDAKAIDVQRLVRWFYGKFSNHQWARRRIGGKWERWWVDCCSTWVWLETAKWSKPGQLPGGAWPSMNVMGYDGTELPKREDYSTNH